MEPIRRPGLWIEKHITPCFRNLFQKMLCFAAQGQQTLSLEDIPVPDIKIGPRQGEKFTLPQTAGQSCVDERECAKLFRCVQIPLELSKAQGNRFMCFCQRFRADLYRIAGNELVAGRLAHTPPQKQMDTPDTSGAESPDSQAVIKAGHGVLGQLCQRDIPDSRGDMTVNQIAVSAHCSAAPSALILTKPPVTPLTHSKIILTVHGFYLLFANATIPQKERNSYCFLNIFFHIPIRSFCLQSGQRKTVRTAMYQPRFAAAFPGCGQLSETAAGCTAPWEFHPSEVLSELPPLLESVAGQKYHCPQMESSQNGLPQTAFRTDGIAHACLLFPQAVFAHRPLSLAPRPGAPSGNVFQQLVILFSRFRCDLRKIPET